MISKRGKPRQFIVPLENMQLYIQGQLTFEPFAVLLQGTNELIGTLSMIPLCRGTFPGGLLTVKTSSLMRGQAVRRNEGASPTS